MENIFEHFATKAKKTATEDPLYDWLINKKRWFSSPDEFFTMVTHQINNIIDEALEVARPAKDQDKLSILFREFNFFERHLNVLCSTLYGYACSSDRSIYIVYRAMEFATDGIVPEFGKSYAVPPTGSPDEWMALVDGLVQLLDGRPKNYLLAYKAIIDSHAVASKGENK